MKALSLWQPWASLWAVDRKRFETRHWAPTYRGPLAIHAAQKLCLDIDDELAEICRDQFGINWAREIPRGALLATSRLIKCLRTDTLVVSPEEALQGNFTAGRYAWDAVDKQLLPSPIPFRGHQSLFDVPDELLGRVSLPHQPPDQLF